MLDLLLAVLTVGISLALPIPLAYSIRHVLYALRDLQVYKEDRRKQTRRTVSSVQDILGGPDEP